MSKPIIIQNQYVRLLPADNINSVYPRQVADACYSLVEPSKTSNPQMICVSQELATRLNISATEQKRPWFTGLFSGNQLLDGMQPYAMCYGGHQFGNWAGQLGDGRAINLGEMIDKNGEMLTLQLKGAGLTPYSRTADGLAVLRSSIREFLCSEAMYYLGIPTTRALSIALTGDKVMRDMFYDGHAQLEAGAVVCRVSPSFLRFGNFQIHAARNEINILKQLADYSISNNFAHLGKPCTRVYQQWFDEVCQSTMQLMIHWMRVGFVHGVMNTDNMSILGQTIDYGPYGWLEGYDSDWTPNTTDAQGKRYCFGNQANVAHWNLFQLANALVPLVENTDSLEASLEFFADSYQKKYHSMLADKLGFDQFNGNKDQQLFDRLFGIFQLTETDMTIFFRCLAKIDCGTGYSDSQLLEIVKPAYYQLSEIQNMQGDVVVAIIKWLRGYLTRIAYQKLDDDKRIEKMNRVNPKYILRNYLVQVAIDKADNGDYSELEKLLAIFKKPYDEQPQYERYADKRPEWARDKAGCSMLSCSS